MRRILRFEAVVSADRNETLLRVADALGAAGGWIVDHSLFSDVMAVVRFSIPGNRLGAFGRTLADAGLRLDPSPVPPDGATEDEIPGQLTLTFVQGTGDLRRVVPAFQ